MVTEDSRIDRQSFTRRLSELARLFLKLGTISFGGPAVFTAIMEEEVVGRRGWVSHEDFLDFISTTNLIPGPNAVEMAAHIGYRRAGMLGSLVAGISFALPAVVVTIACAWCYVRFGAMPQVESLLHGIKPAVLVVLFAAVWRLAKKAMATRPLALIGITVAVASLGDLDEVLVLLLGAVLGMLLLQWLDGNKISSQDSETDKTPGSDSTNSHKAVPALLSLSATKAATATAAAATTAVSLWKLGLFFLKVGAVLYGTGYVLVAYLEGGLVDGYGWLTRQELIDAVAIGQLTPGPITSAVAFVGYLIAGLPGAIVASVAVYTPGFLFIRIIHPLIPRLRRSSWTSHFLDAVGAASIGLMGAVGLSLTSDAVTKWQTGDIPWWTALIAVAAAIASFHPKTTPAKLIIAGGIAGALFSL